MQDFNELPCIISVAERFPDLSIILDHLGKPDIANNIFASWAADIDRLAKHPNVVCKFSGILNQAKAGWTLKGIRPYADHVVNCFGADRLLWGSDWPPARLTPNTMWMASGARLTGTPSGSRTRKDFRGKRDSHLSPTMGLLRRGAMPVLFSFGRIIKTDSTELRGAMQAVFLGGVAIAIVAGFFNGAFVLPLRYAKGWGWENTWLVFCCFP